VSWRGWTENHPPRFVADAIEEMRTKYGTVILRTPPAILVDFLETWDKMAAEESSKNPFFKKVYESQREYAAKVVPAKRCMFPPYSFAANCYFPEKPAAKSEARNRSSKLTVQSQACTLRFALRNHL
jgi:hypothetical protein